MKILATDVLSKGYFFPELPPCFTSVQFGSKLKSIFTSTDLKSLAKGNLTECSFYSVPKAGLGRRVFGIPNPLHYAVLAELLEKETRQINTAMKSGLSASTPIKDKITGAYKKKQTYTEYRRSCFLKSEEASFELRIDISRYYPTIYTHIIPWALHGRDKAKRDRSDRLFGNVLDRSTRNLQSGQTMGLPIGPISSLFISEIIGARLDKELKKKFPTLKGARFIDDHYYYFATKAEAEAVLKAYQSILADYLLTSNEDKTCLKEFPFSTDPEWIISLRSLNATCFKDNSESEQERDIRQFFSSAFDWAEKYPKDEVMKFAGRSLYGAEISNKNWDYYQAWLVKMGLYDPYTLYEICAILYTNRDRVSKDSIKSFVNELLTRHLSKRHSFEVAWTLWLAKILDISIDDEKASEIFNGNDVIPTLIALDLREKGLITKSVRTTKLKIELSKDALSDGRWLLAYEACLKGWLSPNSANARFITSHPFFSKLTKGKVSFYNSNIAQEEIPSSTKAFASKREEELEKKAWLYWLGSTKY